MWCWWYGFVGNLILLTAAIFNGFNRLWKLFINNSSTDNGRDSLAATSLLNSMSPSATWFSGAKSDLASRSWFRSNFHSYTASTVVLTIIHHPFKWVIMVIQNTLLSSRWNFWLSETFSSCLLSHLTPNFLEHHNGFENWCSRQLFILVYRSNDLTNNQGLVFSLQWAEIEKTEKKYKTITFGITRCFLKTLLGEEWT